MEQHEFESSQAGVASRAQLALVGVSSDHIRNQVEARRWQRVGGVVVMHNAELTREQQLWCAVLDQPQPCALGGVTAAIEAGLKTFPRESIHVVIPRHARARRRDGVTVHFAPSIDIVSGGVPRVAVSRAIVQSAIWERSRRVAAGLFIAAFQQGLVQSEEVEPELVAAGPQRHVSMLKLLMADISEGAESLAEIEFTRLVAQAGLPAPERQAVRPGKDGGSWVLDADFGWFAVEIDGPLHWVGTAKVEADLARQNALVRGGQRLLRFSSVTLRTSPGLVINELRAAFRDLARSA